MSQAKDKVPVQTEQKTPSREAALQAWRPFVGLRQEMERLFDDFGRGFWRSPMRSPLLDMEPFGGRTGGLAEPAVDVVDREKAYEITAELPGMDEKTVEVKLANGTLTIKGEKHEEKEEKQKGYYLHERSFGAFERSFAMPDDVDAERIEANFAKGVLTVTLPKKPEAIKPEKKIEVKRAG